MIESLSIRNFKVLRDVDFALQPLTVIVGPNASGKSSILQAIAMISGWLTDSRPNIFQETWRPDLLRSRNSAGPAQISLQAKINAEQFHFKLDLVTLIHANHGDRWLTWNYTLLNLDPKRLAAPSFPKSTSLILPSNGDGLSSILAGLRLEHPAQFDRIVNQLKAVVTNLTNIRARRAQVGPNNVGDELLFDLKGAEGIPASAVSEGTLLTLGVLAALSTGSSPQVVLIDDLERGLHPKALGNYIEQLRILQKQDPELQIIATSHSPYLLDYLRAEEVLLTSLDENGYTVVKSLTDHPDYERWKEVMGPGEFWSTVGEDWITKEKKATA
jgi:predicted ATPase